MPRVPKVSSETCQDPDYDQDCEQDKSLEPKTKKARGRKNLDLFPLTCLPDELVVHLISFITDTKTMIAFMTTCKQIRRVMNPITVTGQRIWSTLRASEGWPDPIEIGISDYAFLKIYYGKGCTNCPAKKDIKAYWNIGGLRVCNDCLDSLTIKEEELVNQGVDPEFYIHLNWSTIKRKGRYQGSYRVFLRSQILTIAPSQEKIKKMKRLRDRQRNFTSKLQTNEEKMWRKRKNENREIRNVRKNAIDALLKDKMPDLEYILYFEIQAYKSSISTSAIFTEKSSNYFWRNFEEEFNRKKDQIAQKQFEILTKRLLWEENFREVYSFISDEQYINLKRTITELLDIEQVRELIEPFKEEIQGKIIKRETQNAWSAKFRLWEYKFVELLKNSDLFKEADPSKEDEFKAFVEKLKAEHKKTKE